MDVGFVIGGIIVFGALSFLVFSNIWILREDKPPPSASNGSKQIIPDPPQAPAGEMPSVIPALAAAAPVIQVSAEPIVHSPMEIPEAATRAPEPTVVSSDPARANPRENAIEIWLSRVRDRYGRMSPVEKAGVISGAMFFALCIIAIIALPGRGTGGAVSAAATPSQINFQEFQKLPTGSYFNVSVPSYAGMNDVFTKSRLYSDRLEMWADPARRNETAYQIAQGRGALGGQLAGGGIEGKGPVFSIKGTLHPCADLGPQNGIDKNGYQTVGLVKMWSSEHSTICLERNRLIVRDSVYIEILNPNPQRMGFSNCRPGGNHGGCIQTNETLTWEILPQ